MKRMLVVAMAVVDKIDGGVDVKRFWLFQPPDLQTVKPTERGFMVTQGQASLQGVFAYPAKPEVNTAPLTYEYVKGWGNNRGSKVSVTVNAMRVPGPDHFFFVGTVTAGEQPASNVDGSGLNAVVTVGKRTVRFDGQKIIMGSE